MPRKTKRTRRIPVMVTTLTGLGYKRSIEVFDTLRAAVAYNPYAVITRGRRGARWFVEVEVRVRKVVRS